MTSPQLLRLGTAQAAAPFPEGSMSRYYQLHRVLFCYSASIRCIARRWQAHRHPRSSVQLQVEVSLTVTSPTPTREGAILDSAFTPTK